MSQPKGRGRNTYRDGIDLCPDQLGLASSFASRTSDSCLSTSSHGSFCTNPTCPQLDLNVCEAGLVGVLHDHPPSQKDITPTRSKILLLRFLSLCEHRRDTHVLHALNDIQAYGIQGQAVSSVFFCCCCCCCC